MPFIYGNTKQTNDNKKSITEWFDSASKNSQKPNITLDSIKSSPAATKKWYSGDAPTWRESIGRAYQIAETDRDRGQKAYNDLQYLKNDPNSRYYRYYASATNGAIKELNNLGFDTSLLKQEGFFSDPSTATFINTNLERSGTTNSPKSPTKKTSTNGRIAYWLTQYQAAMEDTQNAKAEVEKITNKAKTLAGWKDRNYSDDEIMNIIYGKDGEQFRKDYPTLYKMQNRANEFKPVELNEAVDFTQDLLYGATWLGRNADYDGKVDLEQAMAMSYMGKGNVWKEDPVISAKLNPESNSFDPYSVGRTGLDDAALHFGTDRFDNNWLSANQHLVFDGTDEDKKYYNQVLAGKENYDAATTAINALNLWADKYKDSTDYDTIKKDFDTMLAKGYIIIGTGKNEGKVFTKDVRNSQRVDLSILNKMDKSMGKGDLSPTESDKYGTGDLIPMMDSVDYKYSMFLDKMSGQVDYNRHKRVGYDTLAGLDLTKNPEAEREKYPFELIDETKTKKVSRVLDIVEEKLSPKEKQHFAALPNANGMKLAEAFAKAKEGVLMDGPVNTKLLTDPVWLAQMATKQVEKAENDYMATSLQSLQLRNEFEKTEKETEKIQSKIDDLNSEYGDAVLASQNVPEDMTVDIDGLPGMQVTFTQDKNGKYNLSSEFDLDSPFMNNYLASNGISKEEFKKKVNETEQRVNNYADSVREAKKQYENGRVHELEDMDSGVKLEIPYVPDGQGGYTLSPEFNSQSEEVKRYMEASGTTENELWKEINDYMNQLNDGISAYQQQMNALTARLDANSIYLKNNREAYDEAAVAVDRANQRRMRQGDLALRNSGMTIDPAMSDAVLNIVSGFTGYENPQDGYDSVVETLQQQYGMQTFTGEDMKELDGYIAELNSQAELYREIVKNYDLPENYKNSMEQCADWLESRARQYGDYQIVHDKDFAKLAEEGRAEYESATPAGRPLNAHAPQLGFSQMTDFEQDIYFALYKKKGLAAADQFYSDIEGSLLARTKENIRAGAEESAQSGFFGRVFNELVSIGMAGVEVPLNIAYLIGSAVEGEGSKWLRVPSYAAKTANETAIQELHQIYEGTIWDKVWPSLVEMINNRGRSYTTGYLFGSLIPESAGDIIHAFPIATIAFGEAYEEAVDNGLKPWQAWTLGAINFACESVTEGIKYGHYESLFDGNTITLATFKEYFMDKVSQLEWLSEATGETLNNILERAANRYFAGDKSEHNKRVNQYINSGLCSSVKEAEAMVAADYVREDIHTAITSALSDFLDVGMFAAGKLKSTASYALQLQSYRKNVDANATIQTLRERDIQRIRNAEQLQKNMEAIRAEMIEKANQPFNPKNPAEVSEAARQSNQTEYDVDMTILENSADSDQGTVTETIAAVMRVSGQNTNRANAAAVAFVSRNGQNAINELSNMLDAGRKAGTNINTLKLGIQYALLGNGACNQVMNSEAYQNATPEQQAEMLSMATQEDANNQEVQAAVNAAVHENRVAEAEKDIFSEDGAKEIEAFQEAADEADMEAYVAQEEYSDRLDARKEAADNMTTVTMDFLADNSTENQRRKERAENELTAADAVAKEYEQHLRKAQEKQQKTSQALEQTKDEVMARVRQQAEERVAAEEATEAKVEAEAAEQARIAAEEAAQAQAQAQAEEDIRTGKAQEDSDLALIEAQINKLNLKGEQAEQLRQKLTTFYHDMKTGNVDTSRLLSDAEAALAINEMSRRLGVAIDVDKEDDPNALPEGKDGKYSNGKITLSHRLTVGQAMLQVAMHEITHSLEKTKSYGKYKDTVFSIMFSSPEQREKAIQDKIDLYTRSGVKDFTREDAEHEIVADFAMDDKTFANRDTINRMLDEGLGGKIRNALHNINQYLKNAKLDGEEKIKAENLRKAERQYIKAMNERRNINTHPSSEQFSVNQFAAAAGLFYNEVNITDANGNVIAAPGLYTADPSNPDNNAVKIDKVTPEMMENTPVGQLTNAALALGTMDHETVGKIHKMFADLMTMCTNLQDTNLVWEIAGSTLYSEFSAIKSNSDKQYSTTVDFGTICTKTQAVINQLSRDMLRLGRGLTSQEILDVYNDVYNADLKVPCPVCYVFSRWLGVPSLLENIRQYQNRFLGEEGSEVSLEETQRRVDEFIAKAHNEDYNIDEKFIEAQAKARQAALDKIDRIKNGKNGIAQTEAKIAKYRDQLAVKPNGNTVRYLASAEKKLATLQGNLTQAQTDYENSDIAAYAKVINKKKADLEKSIKDKLIRIEGDDKGKRGINDDIRDAIKEGKPTDKLEAKRTAVYGEIDELNKKLREVDAYNWVTQALCRLDENGRFVVDDAFKRTKNEILLDLNRTGEFAKDIKNWTYRSTRGAGMGKAILPYSGASLGDSVLGTGARVMANPFESGDVQGAFNALKSAIMKGKRQNLIGGQRFQSTSDFRPEWGLDYIMTFIEQQAIGSRGQLYTKVNEAVPLYASVGIDTNCSIMPYANGWHDPSDGEIEAMSETERKSRVITFKDDNGNERTVILDFSDVTGMKYDAARLLSKSYDSVQMIMVGINDIHIRACLAGEEIDFVIPWHASGNTKSQLQSMMQTVNETLTNSSDYTKVQSDQIADKKALETAHGKQERDEALTPYEKDLIHKEQMRDARQRLLTGATLTATDMERIGESQFLTSLYERFEGKTLDGKELPHNPDYWVELPGMETAERVKMTSSQAEQIFPYEYWDTTLTKDQADENGWRFVQYCQELGLVPRFSGGNQKDETTGETSRFGNFSGAVYDDNGNIIRYDRERMAKGYWKTLIDRKMYDNKGNYRSQQQIDASKVQAGNLMQGENGRVHTQSNIPDSISGANYRGEEAKAKYRQADQALKDRLTEKAKLKGNEGEQARIDLENLNAWETAHANDHEQYRVTPEINPYEDLTAGEMMQLLDNAKVDFRNYLSAGDIASAQETASYIKSMSPDTKVWDTTLEDIRNEPLSSEIKDIISRLENNENIPLEDYYSVPEIDWARRQARERYSINTDVIDKYKKQKWSPTYIQDVLSELPQEKVDSITRIKNELDAEGSIILNEEGKLERGGEVEQGRRLDVIIGLAAAGKSSIADYISLKYHSGFLDSDDAKKKIEGFDNGIGATYVHPESKLINEWREREAIERGDNVVLPVVGDDAASLAKRLTNYKRNGYDIHLHMMDLAQNKAIGRAIGRYINQGRYIDPSILLGMDPVAIANAFDELKGEGELINGYAKWNNDVPLGEHPAVIESSGEDETRIFELPEGLRSEPGTDLVQRGQNDEFDAEEGLDNRIGYSGLTENSSENGTVEDDGAFSIPDVENADLTPGEMLQLLRDAGVYQQEEAPTDYEATGPQRQFGSETVQNAEGVSQTVKNWLKQHSDYNPDTNDAQINRAVKWVMSKRSDNDPDGFWGALDDVESKNFNPLTADGQARMYTLMSLASNKGRNGNIDVQLRLADAINKQGTTLGQALQARRLYRLMTPEGRLSVLQKEVDRVNNQLKSKGKEGNVKLSNWILRAASAAQTEEEFAKAREAMWQELGEQLPVSWWDRFQAWRMVSMLGNPRTHIRNMVGNLGFVPAVKTKNEIGAVLEHIFLPEGERTKAFKADKAALDFADADADRMQSKLTGEAKYSDKNQIEKNKKPFGKSFLGRIAQGASDFSGDMLEKEDWVFLRYHYKHSLAGWMTANNVTGEQLENDTEMLDKARAYAIEEAQKATYRDANAIAEWLSKGDKIPVWNVISTAVLPFKKTPMNIMKRGLEYSPLGFLKNITVDVARLAEYQKWANGKKAEKADWALSPAQYIDKISSGLTGLGIAGLGAFMKSMGWLTAGFKKDDPEDEFRKKKNQQEYSLNISLFGHNISYTIDWAAPACMPMFVGATIQDIAERGGLGLGQTLQSLASVTEPIWNLSFMDGLNSLFQTNQYESGDAPTQILMKIGLNYASSFVPTAVGQIARTIDTARRKAYVQTGSSPSAVYYSFEQLQNKSPWSVWNIPYRDYRGNEDRKHWLLRAVENMLSPGYAREQVNDDTLNEMERLYKNNQEDKDVKAVVPTDADKSFSVKGEKINLTDQQYDRMDVDRKQYAFELLDQLVADPYYAKVDDAARIDMINDVWTYATQQARYDQFPQVSREDWITRAQKNNLNMLDVIKKRSEDQIESDSVTGWSEALIDSIKKGNLDDVETAVGTLEVHDLDESDVEKIVKKAFQNDYVKAYKDDDDDRMQAIEAMLYDAGFVFDYESWLETTKKNEEKWLEQITGD